ncbi:MAG: metallophosphoesterase family protein [Ktedonobacteraceae bacterium]
MRIAILSDIHGNQVALEAVFEHLAQQQPVDALIVAGDLCLNGPCPREVLETLQAAECPVIQGNVDVDVVTQRPKKGTKKRGIVDWTREQIGDVGIHYLQTLPTSHLVSNPHGTDVLVVHANPLNQEDTIFPTATDKELERLLGSVLPTIGAIAFGHLHIAYQRQWRHLLLLDVGSCGLPRDEDHRASYGVLTWQENTWQAEHHRVEYDVPKVVDQLRTCGMPNAEKRIKVLLEARYS